MNEMPWISILNKSHTTSEQKMNKPFLLLFSNFGLKYPFIYFLNFCRFCVSSVDTVNISEQLERVLWMHALLNNSKAVVRSFLVKRVFIQKIQKIRKYLLFSNKSHHLNWPWINTFCIVLYVVVLTGMLIVCRSQ